ncbi:hypothetical protein [Planosporangium mesophilum]|uniref:hypothetical protein n=1 Tax=Planosporangium mesophilum TaxID=689768 RepID=UPI00143B400E|nr:hypothetical protein [Planosporangium mesophilum]NJC83656.1 hypothetical protein [Planosporangium mesophilum]
MRPVPAVLVGLLDDAAVFPPGNAPLAGAVAAHREHRAAWYAPMVGPLLVPPEDVPGVPDDLEIGVVGPLDAVARVVDSGRAVRQLEVPVAKRGEDPQPGLADLLALIRTTGLTAYAETPLTWGLTAALDTLAEARAAGLPVAPKFRTGGLAAELFPTPVELAAVVCACRDRGLPFKLTAGLHHAIRHSDPETGFIHHGFLNVLVASAVAADGAGPADVAKVLASGDAVSLVTAVHPWMARERPLWIGFGSCSIAEPLADLRVLGLLPTTEEGST